MKTNMLLVVTSLLSILLISLHISEDIVLGFSPGGLVNLAAIGVLVVYLCGALLWNDLRGGPSAPASASAFVRWVRIAVRVREDRFHETDAIGTHGHAADCSHGNRGTQLTTESAAESLRERLAQCELSSSLLDAFVTEVDARAGDHMSHLGFHAAAGTAGGRTPQSGTEASCDASSHSGIVLHESLLCRESSNSTASMHGGVYSQSSVLENGFLVIIEERSSLIESRTKRQLCNLPRALVFRIWFLAERDARQSFALRDSRLIERPQLRRHRRRSPLVLWL